MGTRTNREFVMLASVLDKQKHRIGGMFCSEKMDGMRAVWIPAARGRTVDCLPFANVEKDKKIPTATGLFSRYGKIIYAPESFLDNLPADKCLDGELWMGRQSFQRTMSIVKKHPENRDEEEWKKIKYMIFDSPAYGTLFQTGKINNQNFKKQIVSGECLLALSVDPGTQLSYEFTYNLLAKECQIVDDEQRFRGSSVAILHKQELLPFFTQNALARLEEMLSQVTDEGGEGLMLRHPAWGWEPLRSGFLNKYKHTLDSEAKVVGYVAGKGKHFGRLGSLRCVFNGLLFDIGGFTDEERTLTYDGQVWADDNAGNHTDKPVSLNFPLGSILTFTYRELTTDGIPKEARYLRAKESE